MLGFLVVYFLQNSNFKVIVILLPWLAYAAPRANISVYVSNNNVIGVSFHYDSLSLRQKNFWNVVHAMVKYFNN